MGKPQPFRILAAESPTSPTSSRWPTDLRPSSGRGRRGWGGTQPGLYLRRGLVLLTGVDAVCERPLGTHQGQQLIGAGREGWGRVRPEVLSWVGRPARVTWRRIGKSGARSRQGSAREAALTALAPHLARGSLPARRPGGVRGWLGSSQSRPARRVRGARPADGGDAPVGSGVLHRVRRGRRSAGAGFGGSVLAAAAPRPDRVGGARSQAKPAPTAGGGLWAWRCSPSPQTPRVQRQRGLALVVLLVPR